VGALRRGGAALGVAVVALLLAAAAPAAADDDEAVRSMVVDLRVGDDGSVAVRERITYDFGGDGHHGLERVLPVRGLLDRSHERSYPVQDLRVDSPSGAPDEVHREQDGRTLDVRIGDPDSEDVRGVQTYVLSYRVPAVVDDRPQGQRLAWNVTGEGWTVPVDSVTVTVTAPGPLTDPRCHQGPPGGRDACEATAGGTTATFRGRDVAPGEGVTVDAGMAPGTVRAQPPLVVDTFSPARAFTADATTLPLAGGVLVLGLLATALARRRGTGGDERLPGGAPVTAPWQPAPPDGPPGVLGALVHGGATPDDVVATLLDLARRGHLRLREEADPDGSPELAGDGPGGDWTLEAAEGRDTTSPAEQRLLRTLFPGGETTTSLGELRATSRAGLQLTQEALDDEAVRRGWFRARPARDRRRWLLRCLLVVVAGLAQTAVLALTTSAALVGVAVVVAGVVAALAGRGRSPLTAQGRDVRARTEAFAATLARWGEGEAWPSDGGLRGDDVARHLPHAVALGLTGAWTGVATALASSPRPVPGQDWYTSSSGSAFSPAAFGAGMGGFTAGTAQALATPPPAGPSSAHGGGGGFVGGGAGGGGGGSW